jgi:catechol 2,3-dioxygenase-like lactoylglutathione lyase family enzyme
MVRASMIHHMNVPIDDIETARDFYGRVLVARRRTGQLVGP